MTITVLYGCPLGTAQMSIAIQIMETLMQNDNDVNKTLLFA